MADRAVIYTRVSTQEQAKGGTSLTAQRKACIEYCEREGYQIAEVFVEEGESAKTADRTQLKQLLKYCGQQRNIKAVIVHKLDRFARKVQDHQQLSALLATMGVRLRSVTEPIDDTSVGKLMEVMLSGFAQFDNDVRTERTIKGMKERLLDGRWTFPPPLGYKISRDAAGGKTIVPDELSGPLITQAFGEFATGLYKRLLLPPRVYLR
jgi:site-specific DNA recombinase